MDRSTPDDDVRVSDAQRQAVVDRMSSAVGDGLLTLDEFADHAGRAYAAVTRSQLDEVTRELRLPVLAPAAPPAPATRSAPGDAPRAEPASKRRWVVAIMGGEDRRGRWRTGKRVGAVAIMGGVDLDLRDALLDDDVVEITAWAVMGGVTVIVPEGIPVECSGFMLMGGRSNRIKDVPILPGAPVVRIKGYGMWGGIDVRSKPQGPDKRDRERRDDRHGEPLPPSPPPLPSPPLPASPSSHVAATTAAGLVTIVCTDIVGSTRLADELGDQRWRDVLLAHNAIVRAQLALHAGTEVKTSGDGFLCTFTSARRAVAFAVDVQAAVTDVQLRVGVHAGEVERDGDDVVGRNVALACRLCDVAAPGEVLVSSVVADLADSSSDLAFGDGRELQLAGIGRAVTARPAARR